MLHDLVPSKAILVKKEILCKQFFKGKKLVLVLASFELLTKINKKDNIVLKSVSYIYYLLRFCKNKKNKMQPLIDSSSETNTITPAFISKIGLKVGRINVKAQKLDGSISKSLE